MRWRKLLSLMTLMLVGELIFLLPFVVTRVFRPTFLKVFDITNLELGTAFSLYGLIGMVAYFVGGPIADRFPPRKLLPVSIVATAGGGIVMAAIPSLGTLTLLYGLWGVTTILLFWAGYVKAQRELGGSDGQGRSFGLIDAGRGFVAAAIASSAVFLLDLFLPVSADFASTADLQTSLSKIILFFSGLTAASAILVWFFLPENIVDDKSIQKISLAGVKQALRLKGVWVQAIILLCSYVGYKCTDDFSLYAHEAFGYNDVEAAHIATVSFWIRPVAAVVAGLLGDHFTHSKLAMWCFVIMILGSLVIASGVLQPGMGALIIFTLSSASIGIYGLRGLYYALFKEAKVPLMITGSAVGIVSVIGYTPDVFMGPLMGVVLDNNPGELGHQYLFVILAGFSLIGLLLSLSFRKITGNTISS